MRCGLRSRFRSTGTALLDIADEAEALSCDGADQGLVGAGIADRPARGIDPAGQGRFRDGTAMPDPVNQLVLGHHAIAVFHQMDDEIEHLWLDGNGTVASAQLASVGVK